MSAWWESPIGQPVVDGRCDARNVARSLDIPFSKAIALMQSGALGPVVNGLCRASKLTEFKRARLADPNLPLPGKPPRH
jgi:hypothetical protein